MGAGVARDRGRNGPTSPLEAARALVLRGKVVEGLSRLDAALRRDVEDPASSPHLLAPAVLLALVCDRLDLARSWIARAERRAAGPGTDRTVELRLLRLRVRLAGKGTLGAEREIEEAFHAVRTWKPWMLHFRWLFLINAQRLPDLDATLRKPPSERIPRGSLEYGTRLLALGIRKALARRFREAVIVLGAALREIDRVFGPEAVLARAGALTWLARARAEGGGFDDALRALREAEPIARRFGDDSLRYAVAAARGQIHYGQGRHEEALKAHLAASLLPRRGDPLHRANTAMALINASRCALRLGRAGQARRLLARAETQI